MMARSSNAPSMGRIQKRKTNLSKSSLSACNARPVHTDGPQGDIGLAYSITSSDVARSEGEIVSLFQKRVSFNVARDAWWVLDARLTVASHRVYGWYRPRIPWIRAATLSAFCWIAV